MSKLLSHGKKRPPSAEKLNLDAFCADGIAKASRVVDANASVSIFDDVFNKFKDLEYLVELVQTEQAALASPEKDIRFEGWRVIYEKGVKKGYDWSSQTCDNLEQLWEACVKQTKELSLAPRTGMKHGTYNDIYQFLTNGKYPEEIGYNYQKKKDLRTKCSEFAINSSDQIEYCGRGIRKLVLLEGEVEPFIRYVHLALGHAKYDVVGNVISYHFHTSCSIRQMARTLIGGCTTECHRLATSKDSKGIKIKFQRSPRLHIEISLNNEILPLSDLECLAESSENAVRVGMPISKYRRIFDALANVYDKDHQRLAKDYKLDQQYGLLTAEGKIVLDATVGAEVIFQLHNLYGHVTRMGLEDLVSIHFSCYGLSTFSKGIRSLCSLCVLRSGSPVDATPSEIYGDADYEVLIDWKDGKRNFSIVPLGLDQALVDIGGMTPPGRLLDP